MNKLYLKTLLLCLLSFVSITSYAYDCEVNGVYYNLNKTNKTASVTYKSRSYTNGYYYNENYTPTTITIPSSITVGTIKYMVTSIGSDAFSGCSGLTSVTIPNSVTSIGSSAFYNCSGLTSVTIPNSVTSIGSSAFSGCSGMTSVTIPNSVTSIGSGAFYNCNDLKKVIVPDIAAWCGISFGGYGSNSSSSNPLYYAHHLYSDENTEITDLIIPDGVTSIGYSTFYGCSGLTSVTIPSSVTSIGYYAFCDCCGLEKVIVPDIAAWFRISFNGSDSNPLYYAHHLYSDENIEITNLIIPDGVTSIGSSVFSGCTGLTSVTIGNSVTSIGSQTFYGCSGLTSVTVPSSVTSIGYCAFAQCINLTDLTFSDGIETLSVYTGDGLSLQNTFSNCPIERLYLGRNLYCYYETWESGWDAEQYLLYNETPLFSGYESLNNLTIGDWVTSLNRSTSFPDCSGLISVTIGNSVTSIGNHAFSGCSSLTSVKIPSSVTEIGIDAFAGCSGLEKVIIPDIAAWCNISFDYEVYGLGAYGPISNPLSGAHLYSDENTEIKNLIIPNSVTKIGEWAFYGCSGLKSVTIPSSVTSIGSHAFSGCSGLKSVTIGNSVTLIDYCAFSGCSGLTSVTIPNSVTEIGDYAFNYCSGLTSVTIPNSVTSIGYCAFRGCSGLTSVTIPNSVTSIGTHAFSSCSNLEQITVESANPNYDSRENCNAIIRTENNTLITGCKNTCIPNSVTKIGDGAFYGSGLTSVDIPNSVTSIGGSAFSCCHGLTSVTIPNSVTSIGYTAFYGCSGLKSVISLIQEPEDISTYAFGYSYDGIYYNAILYVPEGTADKYRAKEGWNWFKNIVEGIPSSITIPDNEESNATETERYDINGKRIATPQRGINVVKMSDGTVKKVLVK